MADQVASFLESYHILSRLKFAIRKGTSSADLMLGSLSTWQNSLGLGKDTIVIDLDIACAVDRIWHAGLLSKLKSLGIKGELLRLIGYYLNNRQLKTLINGHTSTFRKN